jgi:hypothetical protein
MSPNHKKYSHPGILYLKHNRTKTRMNMYQSSQTTLYRSRGRRKIITSWKSISRKIQKRRKKGETNPTLQKIKICLHCPRHQSNHEISPHQENNPPEQGEMHPTRKLDCCGHRTIYRLRGQTLGSTKYTKIDTKHI